MQKTYSIGFLPDLFSMKHTILQFPGFTKDNWQGDSITWNGVLSVVISVTFMELSLVSDFEMLVLASVLMTAVEIWVEFNGLLSAIISGTTEELDWI